MLLARLFHLSEQARRPLAYCGRTVGWIESSITARERTAKTSVSVSQWRCLSEAPKSTRSSFHSTICVVEGLLDYERAAAARQSMAVTQARRRAENYLLDRHLFRSLRTGEVIKKSWLRFSFPPFWHYDDRRIDEATEIVLQRRHQKRRWPLNLLHPEHIPLQMETGISRASRWNTLRALRVLR